MAEADDGPRRPMGETAWFRMSVGRQKNADPKWLLPMICRLGHVTKKDVGAIKIGERETSFEIAVEAAESPSVRMSVHSLLFAVPAHSASSSLGRPRRVLRFVPSVFFASLAALASRIA